jgi:hypothetical protein
LVSMLALHIALHELVGDVVVLGEQLRVERHGLGPWRSMQRRIHSHGADRVSSGARTAPVDRAAGPGACGFAECIALHHSLPRLAGCAGSPRISTGTPLRALASTPQPTPQYGQVVRVGPVFTPLPGRRTAADRGSPRCPFCRRSAP